MPKTVDMFLSVEQKSDVYSKDGEIGYLLLTDCWSKGIMTEAVRQICAAVFLVLDIICITGLVCSECGITESAGEK